MDPPPPKPNAVFPGSERWARPDSRRRPASKQLRRPPQTPPYVALRGRRLTWDEWNRLGRPEPAILVEA
jgi:hypothetical protein